MRQKESVYGCLCNLIHLREQIWELAFMKADVSYGILKKCTNIMTFHMAVKDVLF